MADRILLIVGGKLAASGDYRAIRRRLNQRPYLVRVDCDTPRVLASALANDDAVESLTIDADGLRVLGTDVRALQHAIPVAAQANSVRLQRVQPLDDSLESVFEYLADGAGVGKTVPR